MSHAEERWSKWLDGPRPTGFVFTKVLRITKSSKARVVRDVARRERAESTSRQHQGACGCTANQIVGPTQRPTFHLLHLDPSYNNPDESPLERDTRELMPAVSGQSRLAINTKVPVGVLPLGLA